MAIRIKPKTYGPISAPLGPDKKVLVDLAAKQTVAITSPAMDDAATPVEFMIAALGSCLTLSFHHAAQDMKIDVGGVEVSVTAKKAEDLPDRIGSYEASITLGSVPGEDECAELIKRAKARCTVSNSLNGTVDVSVVN